MKSAIRIAAIYAVVSVLWIVMTDYLVAARAGAPEAEQFYQLIKGLVFVTSTAILIFWLISRYAKSMESAANEARAARDSFEQLFRENPAAIVAYNPTAGTVEAANPAACRLFGRSADEFRQLKPEEWLPAPAEGQRFLGIPAGKSRDHLVKEFTRKDGSRFVGRMTESDIACSENQRRIAVIEDLSAEQAVFAAQVDAVEARFIAERARINFLSMISHELRTPLNSVLGFLDLINSAADPQDWKTYATVAKEQAGMMLTLVEQLLDAAASQSGALEVVNEVVSIETFVSAVTRLSEPRCRARGLEFATELKSDLPETFSTDPMKLRQVLDQLISNAVKFSIAGTVRLSVFKQTSAGNGDVPEICFEVADEGIGIAEDRIGEIFEPFQQLESGLARKYSGMGVGLFVVRHFTELLGGRLTLESTPRRGTRITVHLPLGESPDPTMA